MERSLQRDRGCRHAATSPPPPQDAEAIPDYYVSNQGTFHWGTGLALLLSASVLAFVGSIVIATPTPLLRCLGFKTGY